jgi:hypothetical protein
VPFANDIIALVPKERVDDVILFDPSDEIPRVASEIVSIFRKILGRNWTPEIEAVIQ